ncbi:hypothetical protein [Cellulomonas sp.]|uniref:hypothetical protein n=1 Tax=Cellulomonas sp. TaxID=40001 RepID=UPI003BAAA9C4
MRITAADTAGALDASVAFDGWVGAAIAAAASIVVAVVVLLLTLRHDRVQFSAQMDAERSSFLEQVERQRGLVIEQERMRAFAELASELMRVQEHLGRNAPAIEDAFLPVVSAYHRWTLYVPEFDDEFVHGVNRGIGTVREKAIKARRDASNYSHQEHIELTERAVEVRFDAVGGGEDIHWIIKHGRIWHLDPGQRVALGKKSVDRFPRRLSVDLETGEDRLV